MSQTVDFLVQFTDADNRVVGGQACYATEQQARERASAWVAKRGADSTAFIYRRDGSSVEQIAHLEPTKERIVWGETVAASPVRWVRAWTETGWQEPTQTTAADLLGEVFAAFERPDVVLVEVGEDCGGLCEGFSRTMRADDWADVILGRVADVGGIIY